MTDTGAIMILGMDPDEAYAAIQRKRYKLTKTEDGIHGSVYDNETRRSIANYCVRDGIIFTITRECPHFIDILTGLGAERSGARIVV